jgi:hypothetical protein
MRRLHERFPQYGFDEHKGYPTPQHLKALRRYGVCEVYRRSFAPVRRCWSGRWGRSARRGTTQALAFGRGAKRRAARRARALREWRGRAPRGRSGREGARRRPVAGGGPGMPMLPGIRDAIHRHLRRRLQKRWRRPHSRAEHEQPAATARRERLWARFPASGSAAPMSAWPRAPISGDSAAPSWTTLRVRRFEWASAARCGRDPSPRTVPRTAMQSRAIFSPGRVRFRRLIDHPVLHAAGKPARPAGPAAPPAAAPDQARPARRGRSNIAVQIGAGQDDQGHAGMPFAESGDRCVAAPCMQRDHRVGRPAVPDARDSNRMTERAEHRRPAHCGVPVAASRARPCGGDQRNFHVMFGFFRLCRPHANIPEHSRTSCRTRGGVPGRSPGISGASNCSAPSARSSIPCSGSWATWRGSRNAGASGCARTSRFRIACCRGPTRSTTRPRWRTTGAGICRCRP